MSSPDQTFDPKRLDALLEGLCNATSSDAELNELNAILLNDRSARWQYLLFQEVHGELHRRFGSSDIPLTENQAETESADTDPMSNTMVLPALSLPEDEAIDLSPRQTQLTQIQPAVAEHVHWTMSRRIRAAVLALLIGCLGITLILRNRHRISHSPDSSATLIAELNSRWEGASPAIGDRISSNKLNLASGVIRVHFVEGADVLIEGPAAFRVEGVSALWLESGKVTATADHPNSPESSNVPRFVIHTPQAQIADMGTEFGVCVDSLLGTRVAVFRGLVKVTDRESAATPRAGQAETSMPVQAGSAVQIQGSIAPLSQEASPRFIRADDFDIEAQATSGSLPDRVKGQTHRLRRDPRVVALFDFNPLQGQPGRLADLVAGPDSPGGTIVQSPWEAGRAHGPSCAPIC